MDLSRQRAYWIDRSTVVWRFEGPVGDRRCDLVWSPDAALEIIDGALTGRHETLPLRVRPGGLSTAQRRQWPHLADHTAFTVDADEDTIKYALRGQVAVTARDDGGWLLVVTGAQLPGVLDDVYADAVHADLGCRFHDDGGVTISVWAPTARAVAVEWFQSDDEPEIQSMWRDDHTGVWRVDGDWGWTGRRYRFRVEVFHPATGRIETMSVTDPYSVALTADSTHSVVANLLDPLLIPADWATLRKPPRGRTRPRPDARGVRAGLLDLRPERARAARRGTFAAFATPEQRRHAASPEARRGRRQPPAPAAGLRLRDRCRSAATSRRHPPATWPRCRRTRPSSRPAIAQIRDQDGYNWGYDPLHYTVPEGCYATDPDGPRGSASSAQMVAGLNDAGLRVVMDVVYNHTAAGGQTRTRCSTRSCPGYYHRLLDDGTVADSTCCANTAPEHAMMGKLVVDSVVRWARQYKVDGFRFDLMGHHPKANILAVRAALDHLTLASATASTASRS